MEIEVRLFATFREYLPEGSGAFSFRRDFENVETVGDLLAELGLPEDIPKIIIVKANQVAGDYALSDGDVVSFFPPIAGG
jgi:molybdopterin converting factor small subunit